MESAAPLSMIWLVVGAAQPFIRTNLDDLQAVELVNELADACVYFEIHYEAHLVEDFRGGDSLTLVGHPAGIHHFPGCGLDDGCSS